MTTSAEPMLLRLGMAACAMLAGLNLLAGLSGGLARLGWPVPTPALADHGAVLVCGFFGALIALERAVALHRPAGLLAPLAAGAAGLIAWGVGQPQAAALLWLLAAAGLVALYVYAGQTRGWSLHMTVEMVAAMSWALGSLAWSQHRLPAATVAWMAFLVGTIAGERRELTQFVRLSAGARRGFVVIMLTMAVAVLAVLGNATGWPDALWWAACAALSVWLLHCDLAPRQRRRAGWIGHTGTCLTVGYLWLMMASLLGLAGLWFPGGITRFAVHAVLLGFVFAMVFGHAPIILPALTRLRPTYTGWIRWPIWLLAASLVLRMVAVADATASLQPAVQTHLLAAAGAGHALAIALFAALMIRSVQRGRRAAQRPPAQ